MGDYPRGHLQDQRAGHRRLHARGLANQRDQSIRRELPVLVWTRIPRPLRGTHPSKHALRGPQDTGPGRHLRPGMVRQATAVSVLPRLIGRELPPEAKGGGMQFAQVR